MAFSGANKRTTESQDTRSLADSGRPPRANITGSDKAVNANLVPFISANALPHKISEDRSISAAINPLFP